MGQEKLLCCIIPWRDENDAAVSISESWQPRIDLSKDLLPASSKSCLFTELKEQKNRCKLAQWRAPILLPPPSQKIFSFLRAKPVSSGVCGEQGARIAPLLLWLPCTLRALETRAHEQNQLVLETQGEQTEWQFEHKIPVKILSENVVSIEWNMRSILVVFLAFGSLALAAPKKKATTALDNSDLIPIPDHLLEDYHQPSGIIDNLKPDFMFDQPLWYLSIPKTPNLIVCRPYNLFFFLLKPWPFFGQAQENLIKVEKMKNGFKIAWFYVLLQNWFWWKKLPSIYFVVKLKKNHHVIKKSSK